MATFREANQTRLSLKMKFSHYSWYISSDVIVESDGYGISIIVDKINNQIRKIIPPVVNGVSIKIEAEK